MIDLQSTRKGVNEDGSVEWYEQALLFLENGRKQVKEEKIEEPLRTGN